MKKPLAAFAFAFGLLAVPFTIARAECVHRIADVVEGIQRSLPGVKVERLTGAHAAAFIAEWDAIPPVSKTDADTVFVIFHPDPNAPLALINFAKGECAVAGGEPAPAEALRMLIAQTRNNGA